MPTNMELQVEQRKRLYLLLRLKHVNAGITIKELDDLINMTEAEMQGEDIAWVEQRIAQLGS